MIANLALASQGFAEQIAKKNEVVAQQNTASKNTYAGVRKPDAENIFHAKETLSAGIFATNAVVAPVAVPEATTIFSDPVAQSQHKAAQLAHSADVQNYDAGAIAAKLSHAA